MPTTISAEQRDALLEKVQALPDGAIVRVTAIAYDYDQDANQAASTYVTVGPLRTVQHHRPDMRYVGETLLHLDMEGEPRLSNGVQAVEVIDVEVSW